MTCSRCASRTACFARRLAAAIDAERRDRIVFDVGAGLGAVEHVVGRDMHQRDAALAARRSARIAGPISHCRGRAASTSLSALSTFV